jgi:hypothetical protein
MCLRPSGSRIRELLGRVAAIAKEIAGFSHEITPFDLEPGQMVSRGRISRTPAPEPVIETAILHALHIRAVLRERVASTIASRADL